MVKYWSGMHRAAGRWKISSARLRGKDYGMMWVKILVCCMVGLAACLAVLTALNYKRKHPDLHKCGDGYVIYYPKAFFVFFVIGTVIMYAAVILNIMILDPYTAYGLPLILGFFILSIGGAVDTLLWRCVVKENIMTFHTLFWPVRTVNFYEITKVKYTERDIACLGRARILTGYHNKKKAFEIWDYLVGFELFHHQLRQYGKIERTGFKEEFTLRNTDDDIFGSILAVVFLGAIWIMIAAVNDGSLEEMFYWAIWTCITLIGGAYFLKTIMWRVNVTYDAIRFRKLFARDQRYFIREITGIQEKESSIILYAGDKKIAEIFRNCKNFIFLQERLLREEIVWYKSAGGRKRKIVFRRGK